MLQYFLFFLHSYLLWAEIIIIWQKVLQTTTQLSQISTVHRVNASEWRDCDEMAWWALPRWSEVVLPCLWIDWHLVNIQSLQGCRKMRSHDHHQQYCKSNSDPVKKGVQTWYFSQCKLCISCFFEMGTNVVFLGVWGHRQPRKKKTKTKQASAPVSWFLHQLVY